MAAGAHLPGEGAEVFKVNPLAFLQAGGHPGQDRVQDRGRIHLGKEEFFSYRSGELALSHIYIYVVSGVISVITHSA